MHLILFHLILRIALQGWEYSHFTDKRGLLRLKIAESQVAIN